MDTNHVSVAAVMYFKLSAKELEILAERDTVLKRLADNQVDNSVLSIYHSMVRV